MLKPIKTIEEILTEQRERIEALEAFKKDYVYQTNEALMKHAKRLQVIEDKIQID